MKYIRAFFLNLLFMSNKFKEKKWNISDKINNEFLIECYFKGTQKEFGGNQKPDFLLRYFLDERFSKSVMLKKFKMCHTFNFVFRNVYINSLQSKIIALIFFISLEHHK